MTPAQTELLAAAREALVSVEDWNDHERLRAAIQAVDRDEAQAKKSKEGLSDLRTARNYGRKGIRSRQPVLTPPDLEEERMKETIKPATDTDITDMKECLAEERHEGWHFCEDFGCTTMRPFIARIDSDRALVDELVTALDVFTSRGLGREVHPGHVAHDLGFFRREELDMAQAALAKARAARPVGQEVK